MKLSNLTLSRVNVFVEARQSIENMFEDLIFDEPREIVRVSALRSLFFLPGERVGEAQEHYTKKNPLPLLNLGAEYYSTQHPAQHHILYPNSGDEVRFCDASSGLQSIAPLLVLADYYFTNKKSIHLVVEYPEQNISPETQRDLIYYLIGKLNAPQHDHRLTLTTYSPYVLYTLDNCMMAGLVGDKMSEEAKQKLSNNLPPIAPDDVSAYEVYGGEVKCIQQPDGLIANNYFDTKMKKLMDDFYLMLSYYE